MKNCITLGNFTIVGILHKGNDLTNIFKVQLIENNCINFYALKIFPKTKRAIAEFSREKEVLKEIYVSRNPYIVGLKCFLQIPKSLCIVFEYMENRSLRNHLDVDGKFVEDRVKYYSACILSALQFLHCSRVTHGDVHLRNMMLDGTGRIKLIDFGRSQLHLGASVFGTVNFYSDFKQLGLTVYEMLSDEMVFYPDINLINKELVSTGAFNLIENLLDVEKKKLEDARDLLTLPFLKAIDIVKLSNGSLPPSKFNKLPDNLMDVQPNDLEFDISEDPLVENLDFLDVPLVEYVVKIATKKDMNKQ